MRILTHAIALLTLSGMHLSSVAAEAKRIEFNSRSPYEFSEVINNLDTAVKTKAYGKLRYPEGGSKETRYPVIVALPDAFGFQDHHEDYLRAFREAGFATFQIHSFQSRGIKPEPEKIETRVSPEMMATDAYFALRKLQTLPDIDPKRIGIIGWGSSAGSVLYATWGPAKHAYLKPEQQGFAAHISIYPPCMLYPKTAHWQKIPTKIIIGAKDQSTPASACKKLVKQMKSTDMPVQMTILKGAYHGFDRNDKLKTHKDSYTFAKCRFILEPDGVSVHPQTGIRMINPFFRLAAIFACTKKQDLKSGGNKQAKATAIAESVSFFQQNLR